MTNPTTIEDLAANVVTCRKAFAAHNEARKAAQKVSRPDADGFDADLHGAFEVANTALHRWIKSLEALRLVAPEVCAEEEALLEDAVLSTGSPQPCLWLDAA